MRKQKQLKRIPRTITLTVQDTPELQDCDFTMKIDPPLNEATDAMTPALSIMQTFLQSVKMSISSGDGDEAEVNDDE